MAGGGVKCWVPYGSNGRVSLQGGGESLSIHHFHATMLNLLSMNHSRLTYPYDGRESWLTDMYGEVIGDIWYSHRSGRVRAAGARRQRIEV